MPTPHHHPHIKRGSGVILLSLALAMTLRIVPWPHDLAFINPDWVLLALVYWCLAIPERVGIGMAWLVGLTSDALVGKMLGQQALAYTVIAYVCLRFYQRLRLQPLTQQTLMVLAYLAFAQSIDYWILNAKGLGPISSQFWWSSGLGALLWPAVFLILRRCRRAFQID